MGWENVKQNQKISQMQSKKIEKKIRVTPAIEEKMFQLCSYKHMLYSYRQSLISIVGFIAKNV